MFEPAKRSLPAVPVTPWMKALPPAMRLVLHGDARARALAAPIWGVAFAEQPCRAIARNGRATLWLGPDEYLLLGGDDESQGDAASSIEHALSGVPHALVDISHRQFALEVSGPLAATLLSGACPLDLNLAEFPVGMCTRTVFAKADILLWRTGEDMFHLEAWRSYSGYVTGLLCEIALEYDASWQVHDAN